MYEYKITIMNTMQRTNHHPRTTRRSRVLYSRPLPVYSRRRVSIEIPASTGGHDVAPPSSSTAGEDDDDDDCIITETLETPLGLLLAENTKEGCVYIESIEPHSHADTCGVFKPGDILVACSAIAMKSHRQEKDGDVSVYNRNSRGRRGGCCSTGCPDCPFTISNWQRIMFDCRGKSFDAVIAALSSNNARWVRRNTPTTITLTVSRAT
jgi:hypothetical protein